MAKRVPRLSSGSPAPPGSGRGWSEGRGRPRTATTKVGMSHRSARSAVGGDLAAVRGRHPVPGTPNPRHHASRCAQRPSSFPIAASSPTGRAIWRPVADTDGPHPNLHRSTELTGERRFGDGVRPIASRDRRLSSIARPTCCRLPVLRHCTHRPSTTWWVRTTGLSDAGTRRRARTRS